MYRETSRNRNANAQGDDRKSAAKKTANTFHPKSRSTRSNNVMPKKETLRNILVHIGGAANPVPRDKGAPKPVDNAIPCNSSNVAAKIHPPKLSHVQAPMMLQWEVNESHVQLHGDALPEGARRTRSSSRHKSERE
jgi:hypothetical protein